MRIVGVNDSSTAYQTAHWQNMYSIAHQIHTYTYIHYTHSTVHAPLLHIKLYKRYPWNEEKVLMFNCVCYSEWLSIFTYLVWACHTCGYSICVLFLLCLPSSFPQPLKWQIDKDLNFAFVTNYSQFTGTRTFTIATIQ